MIKNWMLAVLLGATLFWAWDCGRERVKRKHAEEQTRLNAIKGYAAGIAGYYAGKLGEKAADWQKEMDRQYPGLLEQVGVTIPTNDCDVGFKIRLPGKSPSDPSDRAWHE